MNRDLLSDRQCQPFLEWGADPHIPAQRTHMPAWNLLVSLLLAGGEGNGSKNKNKKIPSKNNGSLVSTLAAAQTLRLDLAFHVSRAEGQPVYSVGSRAQGILLSWKRLMTTEIKCQKVRLCQNALKKTPSVF